MKPTARPALACLAALLTTSTLALIARPAGAAALGEPLVVSAIGEPLRIEIALAGEISGGLECLKLRPNKDDDGITWIRKARLAINRRAGGSTLLVTHPAPVFDPVVKLGIEEFCDTRLQREYTLLLPFPGDPVNTPLVAPTAPVKASETEAEKPRPRAPRAAPAATTARPTPATAAADPVRQTARAPTQDRLVLGGGSDLPGGGLRLSRELGSIDRIGATPDSVRDQLRREQAVLMEIDRTIVAQMELDARIRQLEEMQTEMLQRAKQQGVPQPIPAPPGAAPVPPEPAATTPPAPAPVADGGRDLLTTGALAALSVTLAGTLLWLRRRRAAQDATTTEPYETAPPRPEAREPVARQVAAPIPRPSAAKPLGETSATRDEEALERTPPVAERTPLSWDTVAESSEPLAPILPIAAIEDTAEEHESAIELADIMMGFGRIQGAAETLAEFIASNPKRAVTPWLKLLEVYRAAELRQEFDALAMQLNKTFNVKAVTWDTFEEAKRASHSIEQMAHIANKLQRMWGTTECQAYLERLLRDNRDGKREGFPLCVIDEILMLADVLEAQLGPYRPPPQETSAEPAPMLDPLPITPDQNAA